MVAARAGKGEQLDHQLRQRYERRFGVDLGHVRIFTGEFAEEFANRRNAYAVTIGTTGMIMMGGSPEKSMGTAEGQALLAHELTHAAQAQKHLARAARSQDMEFAQEHEVEAEQVEREVAAEERGGGPGGKQGENPAKKAAELRDKVLQRVLDMLAESGRIREMREGPAPRRA